VTDKFGFIAAECAAADDRALPTIARMCLLLEVSKTGFYEWLRRPVSAAQRRRELLADKVKALFDAFGATYGYRRIHAELVRAGERVGPELVRKLMGEMDLIPVQPRPFRITTSPARMRRTRLIWSSGTSPPRGRAPRLSATSLYPDLAGLAVFGVAD
jgi:hypothetical protein